MAQTRYYDPLHMRVEDRDVLPTDGGVFTRQQLAALEKAFPELLSDAANTCQGRLYQTLGQRQVVDYVRSRVR